MQLLCTLRDHRRQWPRNTRYQADATPYLGRTFTGRIAPACGWRTYSITSSAQASSARGAPGVNFCNRIKIDETRFIHLVKGCVNLRQLELSSVSQMIASNFRDHGDVHNHPCRRRLDRLRWANQAD